MKISTIVLGTAVWLGAALSAYAAPASTMTLHGTQAKTLSAARMAAADRTATHGTVSKDKKTVTFHTKQVRLVVYSGPANDMLSYRIDGLRNPTLIVPAGATIKALYINTDDDMTHNLRFGASHTASAPSVGSPNLAHKTETAYHAADVTVQAPSKPGTLYYLCTIPGHAQGGMYGKIIVH